MQETSQSPGSDAMESDVKIVVFTPRDFETEAMLEAFERRKHLWKASAPFGGSYPVFCYADSKPYLSVVVCTADDQTGTHFAHKAISRLLASSDSRLRPVAFFVCGTVGAALHLHTKDKAQIGDVILARTSLALSNISLGENTKIRGLRSFLEFSKSDVGRNYARIAGVWNRATARMLRRKTPIAFLRADNLTSDVKIGVREVMDQLANVPGLETCEMEFSQVAETVAEQFGSVNDEGFPSVQMIKGLSDFVGGGHYDENRRIAAASSAAATLAFLEMSALRADWNGRLAPVRNVPSRGRAVAQLLEKIAASVRSHEHLTTKEWDSVIGYVHHFGSDAHRDVLEAVEQAAADACSGCGSHMADARSVLHNASPLLANIDVHMNPTDLLLPNIVQKAWATSLQRVLGIDSDYVSRVIRYQPTLAQAEDYRLLLVSLLYFDIEEYGIAEQVATRMVEVTRLFAHDRPAAMLQAMSCRLCMLARHRRMEAINYTKDLLESVEKAKIPRAERAGRELAIRVRFFQYEMNTLPALAPDSDEHKGMVERLIVKARKLLEDMRSLSWNAPNVWLTGLLVSMAKLTSDPGDIVRAQDSMRHFLNVTGQSRHCLHDVASWCVSESRS